MLSHLLWQADETTLASGTVTSIPEFVSVVVPTALPELSPPVETSAVVIESDAPRELRVLPEFELETALPLSEETVDAFTVLLVAEIEPAFTVFA